MGAEQSQEQFESQPQKREEENLPSPGASEGKRKKCKWVVPVIVIILLLILGVAVLAWKTDYLDEWLPPSIKEMFGRRGVPEEAEEDETADWETYSWRVLQFKYPQDWKVEEDYYRTPSQEAVSEPASVVGLTLSPKDESVSEDRAILFGGRQRDCQILSGIPRCFTFYAIPVYTFSEDSEILRIFDLLIQTITYNNSNAAFQISFPTSEDWLEPSETYTIKWRTKPDLQVQEVKIEAFDTSKYWQEGLILSVENISNIGSYEWTVPSEVESEGLYLIEVSYCEPILPPPPGTISSCQLYEGWSDPFDISISNQ